MRMDQIATTSIGLAAVPNTRAGFGVPLLLVDHADIPIYLRYRMFSQSDYTDLTAASAARLWLADMWGQGAYATRMPKYAYVGRWISAASSPHFVCGHHNTTMSAWTGVTAGRFAVVDNTGTPLKDEVTCGTMASCTSIADVCTVMQAALFAISSPNISGLKTATVALDANGRIVLTNSTTGAAAKTVAIVAPASGTDITGSGFLDVADGIIVSGYDAEGSDDALSSVLDKTNVPFMVALSGGDGDDVVELASVLASYNKMGCFVVRDTDAKEGGTDNAAYDLSQLANQNCYLIYTEHTGDNPDAAMIGKNLAEDEGSVNWALSPIANCYESGLDSYSGAVKAITDAERAYIKAAGCDVLVKPSNLVHSLDGLAPGGNEIRLMIYRYYAQSRISEAVYSYLIANKVVTFSDTHIQLIGKGCVKPTLDIGVSRQCLEPDYEFSLPEAADFTTADKATHVLTMSDIASTQAQVAVNAVDLSLVIAV